MLLSSTISAEIIEIHQLKELEKPFSAPLKSTDWVLFDIDYTLTEPQHPILQMSVIKHNKQRFKEELATFTPEQKDLVPILMVTQFPSKLIDCDLPWVIRKLKDDCTVLGFTAADTSVVGDVGAVPQWRQKELKRLGIDFSPNPKTSQLPNKNIEFTQFSPFRGTFPIYQNGILYANVNHSKGEVLAAFLDKTAQKPTKVIFIDDTLENIRGVEAEMKNRGIPFLGVHYRVPANESVNITESEWRAVWDKIHDRAEKANILEGVLQTGNIAAIEWAAHSMPKDSIIIFDVGNVLLAHKDAILNYKYRQWIKEWFEREAPEIDKSTWRSLSATINREAEMVLVNKALPEIINEGKQKGTVIALSRFWCGPSDTESSFERHRLVLLKNVGISFDDPFPNAAGWHHSELEATYSNGLVQTEAPLKGPVLEAFLKHVGHRPKAILFVDDRKDQCDSISQSAKRLGIPALCIQYTEAIDRTPAFDPAIADLQLRTLVYERRWISDDAARHLLLSMQDTHTLIEAEL